MTLTKPRVALALFVKNEFSDIAGWIAWHAALGVTTFFIYDDHSTDGTWEILQSASDIYDVRLIKTDPVAKPDFYFRQQDSFMEAIRRAAAERIDWIGLLDGDEYVYLKKQDSLVDFFARFDHADAVGFSWRIYGSSGRMLRPHVMPVEAFTRHSTTDLGDNLHIKSFVRPERTGNHYHDPHWFDVPMEKYVRPSGKFVTHSGPGHEIEWTDGFVMHFICRSMEHYLERIRRRKNFDISDSLDNWNRFNLNDIEDTEPTRLLRDAKSALLPIHTRLVENAAAQLREDARLRTTPLADAAPGRPSYFRITSFFETSLCLSPGTGNVLHATEDRIREKGYVPLYGRVFPETPDMITLFSPDSPDEALDIPHDHRLSRITVYRIARIGNGHTALQLPSNNMYMAFKQPSEGEGVIEANRRCAEAWEYVSLVPADEVFSDMPAGDAAADTPPDRFLPITLDTSLEELRRWIASTTEQPDNERFLRALYAVSPSTRHDIMQPVRTLLWHMEYH